MVFIKCLAWFSTNGQLAIRQIKKLRPRALVVKSLPASSRDIRDVGSIPELGRAPGGEHDPLQYSCLENLMDRGAWGWRGGARPGSRVTGGD